MSHLDLVRALFSALAVMLAAPAAAEDYVEAAPGKSAGDVMIRLRGIGIFPRDHADIEPVGGEVDIANVGVPEIDISYFITDSIALELIVGAVPHEAVVRDTDLGDVDLGDAWLFPPTLLAQHHFFGRGTISPYVGAGINYTMFFGVDEPENGIVRKVEYEDGFGWVLQIGLDVRVAENWYLNADVKHLWLDTDVRVNDGSARAHVDMDPWIVGLGIGYKF